MQRPTLPFLLLLVVLSGCAQDAAVETAAVETASQLIAIRNARVPVDGILTGGQPNPKQLTRLSKAGYRTVVNLRLDDEKGAWDEEAHISKLGMRYIHIPVAGADGVSVENAGKLAEAVGDKSLYPLVIHCGSGDRVGALFAMKAFHVNGKDAKTAMHIGARAGLSQLKSVVQERLKE